MKRFLALVLSLLLPYTAMAAPDLYMKDTPADTGVEPNPDTGPMWVTEDIWVRNSPDPSYQPYPFPELSPPWTPLPHQNPEYRDPKYSVPNYVYVRVRNRGTTASTGTERLRVYWAKASTGLGWPAQWVDYLANNCGPTKLYGIELTKARKNAATATAAERTAYVNAILAQIGFLFFGGVDYWHKQNEVHSLGPMNRHGTPAFLPWHREFVNRYEALLQEADPKVKLLYWDWTTDPENSTGGFNFFTSSFMGASGRGTSGVSIGAPFLPTLSPPAVTRQLSSSTTPPPVPDSTLLGVATYPTFASNLENSPNHNSTHGYIGGSGNMSFISTAAQDPFFFLLHGNVDRLWAQWQRNTANLARLDPATTYGSASGNINITTPMGPWDGTGTPIQPWTIAGGYIVSKLPSNPSVVFPPVYDSAPLVIPPLAPGQAAVIQIPWYPPNPADFACFGADQGHFCLLARIETSTTAPYGMTFPETTDVNGNTRNNNNIVWKNVTVVDNFPGALKMSSIIVRNIFRERVRTRLRFVDSPKDPFTDFGQIFVTMPEELIKRWQAEGGEGKDIKVSTAEQGATEIALASRDASIDNIPLEPNEAFPVTFRFELPKDYRPPQGVVAQFDLVQVGTPTDPDAVVGGQRFSVDFNKLVLVPAGDEWRYLDDGSDPGTSWTKVDYDDGKWKKGPAELGYGDDPATTIDGGPAGKRTITSYYRHSFDVADPTFYRTLTLRLKRDDGAIVYLNGAEVHRVNLPDAVDASTRATRTVSGIEEEAFFPVAIAPDRLLKGSNVLAVEIHQDSADTDDSSFDLELTANRTAGAFPPDVRFAAPVDGALWQTGARSSR